MNTEDRIDRIKKMEDIFNRAKRITTELDGILPELQELLEYYGSKNWFEDLEADEKGELPADLLRGVLSEDGVYNYLTELKTLATKLNQLK